jgi:hypothetical protein
VLTFPSSMDPLSDYLLSSCYQAKRKEQRKLDAANSTLPITPYCKLIL